MLVPVDLYRLQNVAQTIGRSCGVDDLALILRNRATQFAFPSRVIPGKEGSRNVRFSVKVHPLRRTLRMRVDTEPFSKSCDRELISNVGFNNRETHRRFEHVVKTNTPNTCSSSCAW
eukprot:INCI17139.11.p1 GENE.INCI17139.11~~INCI17139.11.p1  ORF type:complete len:117 (+),score=13.21 INCI17139.11:369-719(+)